MHSTFYVVSLLQLITRELQPHSKPALLEDCRMENQASPHSSHLQRQLPYAHHILQDQSRPPAVPAERHPAALAGLRSPSLVQACMAPSLLPAGCVK